MVQGFRQESGVVVERQSVTGKLASIIQAKIIFLKYFKKGLVSVQKVKAASSG
jgi:hypothetical protein